MASAASSTARMSWRRSSVRAHARFGERSSWSGMSLEQSGRGQVWCHPQSSYDDAEPARVLWHVRKAAPHGHWPRKLRLVARQQHAGLDPVGVTVPQSGVCGIGPPMEYPTRTCSRTRDHEDCPAQLGQTEPFDRNACPDAGSRAALERCRPMVPVGLLHGWADRATAVAPSPRPGRGHGAVAPPVAIFEASGVEGLQYAGLSVVVAGTADGTTLDRVPTVRAHPRPAAPLTEPSVGPDRASAAMTCAPCWRQPRPSAGSASRDWIGSIDVPVSSW